MSVYVTGDIHGGIDIDKLTYRWWPHSRNLKESDTVIICGDFGLIWDNSDTEKKWIDWFNEKPYTTCFVDGNHENFDLLKEYPVVDFHGGKAQKISDKVYRLMRGEVFTFDGKKYFAMGGARSHDKYLRKEGESWWPEELPSKEEYEHALDTICSNDYKFDYILSHCAPTTIRNRLRYGNDEPSELNKFFEEIVRKDCKYNTWYFGHYHIDKALKLPGDDRTYRCVWYDVVNVG